MRSLSIIIGLLLLIALEIFRVYFIMPFPGSQHTDTIGIAYFLDRNIVWLRILALLITLPGLMYFFRKGRVWQRVLITLVILLYAGIFYMFNFRFLADKMFLQPKTKQFTAAAVSDSARQGLVMGVTIAGESKAYPIQIIGYHHQVRDTVGGQPVMVTYCTVCRTGRVFSPVVNGHPETFRLVGMDHFNAMFEDQTTHSWWRQATGLAIAGPLKGRQLREIPSTQMRLADWQSLHPASLTMQADPFFRAKYDSLRGYDQGTIKGSLEARDTGSWKFKSWVIGVSLHGVSKAYDWNRLVRDRIIQDTIGQTHLLLIIAPGNSSFYALSVPDTLQFRFDAASQGLLDDKTHSSWGPEGICISGPLKGQTLAPVQAYQEFWHSWRTFHPGTAGETVSTKPR